ncbi:MAG: RtcB family protein [Bacteroidales bacterium]|nr:RtcB family protein [Bacteroidales bacterium]
MKKLKLSGKDIRRAGIKDSEVISVVKNVMQKHYKHSSKGEVQLILQDIAENPQRYLKHEKLSKIAEKLYQPAEEKSEKQKTQHIALKEEKTFEIFGEDFIEPSALDQMHTAMKLPIALKGAVMPDAHQGYGLPIGGVLAAENAVLPFGVGMDIGCRMAMSIYPLEGRVIKRDSKKLKNILMENTRFGRAEFDESKEHPVLEREEFKNISFLKGLHKKAYDQLGTSGHGNHFVDLGILEVTDESNLPGVSAGQYLAVLSHSGSRGMGAEIARHYTEVAREKLELPKGARQLAWLSLDTEEGQAYWQAMTLAGDYSAANHDYIHRKLAKALGEQPIRRIENHHNFAWIETGPDDARWVVHRKGATPAAKGDLGIIPGSMAAPAFVVEGKGYESSLNSAAHGAGRLMSRSKAKKTYTEKQIKGVLKDKGIELIGGSADEAPMVYKDIHKVMELQRDMVGIEATFYPKIVRME